MAHPMAGVAMTFPNTWLNECLHSVKKIDQWVRFRERSEKKRVFFTVTEINLSREKSGRSVRRREFWEKETAGDIRYRDRVCVC